MPLICLASWVWKATMRTCLIAFSGEIPLLLKSLQSSLAWTREHSHNRWLFLFLQSQSCFLAPIPENSLAALPQGHTPVTLWLCLRYGCSLSLSLSLLLLLMWHPSNAKPLHSCFKFWCSLSCVLTWAEGHLLRLQVTSIIYLVPESETVLSVLMTRGYNCFQLHDKTLSWYEDTWTWSCSTASIHLHHWGFLWLCEHPQLRVWGKAEEHNSHTWWTSLVSLCNRAPSSCLRKESVEQEWIFSCILSQFLGSAVPGETRLWGIRPFRPKEGKIQGISCQLWYFDTTDFSTMV